MCVGVVLDRSWLLVFVLVSCWLVVSYGFAIWLSAVGCVVVKC